MDDCVYSNFVGIFVLDLTFRPEGTTASCIESTKIGSKHIKITPDLFGCILRLTTCSQLAHSIRNANHDQDLPSIIVYLVCGCIDYGLLFSLPQANRIREVSAAQLPTCFACSVRSIRLSLFVVQKIKSPFCQSFPHWSTHCGTGVVIEHAKLLLLFCLCLRWCDCLLSSQDNGSPW